MAELLIRRGLEATAAKSAPAAPAPPAPQRTIEEVIESMAAIQKKAVPLVGQLERHSREVGTENAELAAFLHRLGVITGDLVRNMAGVLADFEARRS